MIGHLFLCIAFGLAQTAEIFGKYGIHFITPVLKLGSSF
jgi:hypothetical protein